MSKILKQDLYGINGKDLQINDGINDIESLNEQGFVKKTLDFKLLKSRDIDINKFIYLKEVLELEDDVKVEITYHVNIKYNKYIKLKIKDENNNGFEFMIHVTPIRRMLPEPVIKLGRIDGSGTIECAETGDITITTPFKNSINFKNILGKELIFKEGK